MSHTELHIDYVIGQGLTVTKSSSRSPKNQIQIVSCFFGFLCTPTVYGQTFPNKVCSKVIFFISQKAQVCV